MIIWNSFNLISPSHEPKQAQKNFTHPIDCFFYLCVLFILFVSFFCYHPKISQKMYLRAVTYTTAHLQYNRGMETNWPDRVESRLRRQQIVVCIRTIHWEILEKWTRWCDISMKKTPKTHNYHSSTSRFIKHKRSLYLQWVRCFIYSMESVMFII